MIDGFSCWLLVWEFREIGLLKFQNHSLDGTFLSSQATIVEYPMHFIYKLYLATARGELMLTLNPL